jgi:probable phosphoglycerate mutase
MSRTQLYLVRHGEQDPAPVEGRDGGLTQLGREQADRLGLRLAAVPFSAVHHSPLARAAETAEVIARHLTQVPRHSCAFVTDRTPVPSAGQRRRYPEHWLGWLDEVPGDERDEDAAALQEAVEHFGVTGGPDRYELLVTHNFVIGWFVRHVLDAPIWRWIGLNHSNCGITILQWDSDRVPTLVSFNDTGHL